MPWPFTSQSTAGMNAILLAAALLLGSASAASGSAAHVAHVDHSSPCFVRSANRTELVTSTRPHLDPAFDPSKLPLQFDWRDHDGANLVTISRNQHIPNYCGACWTFAATSSSGGGRASVIRLSDSHCWWSSSSDGTYLLPSFLPRAKRGLSRCRPTPPARSGPVSGNPN